MTETPKSPTVIEIIGSGGSSQSPRNGEFEKKYRIIGTSDDSAVRSALFKTAPATLNGLPIGNVTCRPVDHNVFEATVVYSASELERLQSTFNFNTTGATTHINNSLGTVGSYELEAGRGIPDFNGGINVTRDEVRGLDVTIPTLNFTETHKYLPSIINTGFVRTLMGMTGTVNNTAFRGFAAGEVLFKGATGSYNDDLIAVTFNFECSANRTINVAGTSVDKPGHDYLWIYYEQAEDDNANAVISKPRSAYVERVYPYADFTALYLPTNILGSGGIKSISAGG